jgi:phage-related baseplate assembly protein
MTTLLSAAALLVKQTADEILAASLELAAAVGLPVTSWRVGDPTRTQLRTQARKLESLDAIRLEYARSSFLETATGDMLTLRASDVYNAPREEETFATPTITVDNTGGGYYEIDARGFVFTSSATGATYVNQSTVTIDSLETGVEILLIAEVGGSAGSAAVDEIDEIVSPALDGIEIQGNTASLGVDEQSDEDVKDQCTASLGALSPDGPADAYEFVARNSELTGIDGITRAYSDGDTADGTVTVFVGTATAAVGGASITAIQAAVDVWAQPLCTDATVASMTPVIENMTFTITPASPAAQDAVETALEAYFAEWDYDDAGGLLARDALAAVVRAAVLSFSGSPPYTVVTTVPASDQAYDTDEFPVRGTVTLA